MVGWLYFLTRMIPGMAAALLWELLALALSAFLGGWNGWWILYVSKGRVLGGLLAAGCFALGHWLPARGLKNKEV